MSVIKSYAVGNGDMFYIDRNNDSFSIIDYRLENNFLKGHIIITA